MSHLSAARHRMGRWNLPLSSERRRDNVLNRVLGTWRVWETRIRQRRDLKVLADSPDLLMDIGVSRYDALREGQKPFWRE